MYDNLPGGDENHEVGGGMDVFKLDLIFYSEALDVDEITESLGVSPTMAWNPFEKHTYFEEEERVTPYGKWIYSTEFDDKSLAEKIEDLFSELTPDITLWNQLTEKYCVWIEAVGIMKNWNREFLLDSEAMASLLTRGVEISFDIYFKEEN